jgi:hypothetical protein
MRQGDVSEAAGPPPKGGGNRQFTRATLDGPQSGRGPVMTDTTTAPDLGRPLRRALPRLQWATGLDATMAGSVTHGGRRLVVTELHGLLTTTMNGLVADPGMGIGGKALLRVGTYRRSAG